MKHLLKSIRLTAAWIALAAVVALAVPTAAWMSDPGEEAEGKICERALAACLSDLTDGLFDLWTLGLRLTYCLSGNEFCKKYIEPFL